MKFMKLDKSTLLSKTLRLIIRGTLIATVMLALSACSNRASNLLNPFYESPPPVALLGEANDRALTGGSTNEDKARMALEAMGTYQRAHLPQPAAPVVRPAVVRLMWVPDHVNRSGDLVPAHFYYLKVKGDDWAVQDAFEMEAQLHGPRGRAGASSTIPFVLEGEKR